MAYGATLFAWPDGIDAEGLRQPRTIGRQLLNEIAVEQNWTALHWSASGWFVNVDKSTGTQHSLDLREVFGRAFR